MIRPDDAKLKELILLICKESEDDPRFGAVKLNKLLFYCDFSAYVKFEAPITGQEYFALPEGPALKKLKPFTEWMREQEDLAIQKVEYYHRIQERSIALRPPDLDVFSPKEVALIYETIQKYKGKNATEMSEESHSFLGWKAAQEKEVIPYCTALVEKRLPTEEEIKYGISLERLAESHLLAHR